MKKIFLILLFFFLLALGGTADATSHGGGTGPTGGGGTQNVSIKIDNPFRVGVGGTLFDLIETIVDDIILPIGGVLAVLAFIYAGFMYVTAQGDAKKISDAHRTLLYTAIGTAVLLGSWAIANVIGNTIDKLK